MKKMGIICGMAMAALIGIGTYTLMNKQTKVKADKLINNLLDKASNAADNMMN